MIMDTSLVCRYQGVLAHLQYPSCIPPLAQSASRINKTGRFLLVFPTGRIPKVTPSLWTSVWQQMGEGYKRLLSMTALLNSQKRCIWQKALLDKQVSGCVLWQICASACDGTWGWCANCDVHCRSCMYFLHDCNRDPLFFARCCMPGSNIVWS